MIVVKKMVNFVLSSESTVMSVEQQKLSLIEQIAALNDAGLVYRLAQFLNEQTQAMPASGVRQAGFAKGVFPYVADDFDNTLPPGFDDYLRFPTKRP